MRGDVEPLPLARPIFQIESLLQIFQRFLRIAFVVVGDAQHCPRHGKVRVQFHRALKVRDCSVIIESQVGCLPQAEFLQCIQRRSRGGLEWGREFLH
jgi:hypothetical protein